MFPHLRFWVSKNNLIFLIYLLSAFILSHSPAKSVNLIIISAKNYYNPSPLQKDSLKYILQLIPSGSSASDFTKISKREHVFTSRIKLDEELDKQITHFRTQGFVLASIDSVTEFSEQKSPDNQTESTVRVKAYFFQGNIYKWGKIQVKSDSTYPDNSFIKKLKKIEGTPVGYSQLNKLEHQLLNSAENQGYPFAQLITDSLKVEHNRISLYIYFNSGMKITYDSLDVQGPSKTKKKFWVKKLGIFPDEVYNEQKIRQIPIVVKKLYYTKLVRKPEVSFYQDRAIVRLRVEDIPSSFFDGIIGFAPSNELEKRLEITGEVTLGLRNLGGTGKSIDAEWRKTNRYSQELLMGYKHPQFLTPRLEIDVDFSILKYDTLYNDILRKLTLIQQTGLNTSIHLFGEFFSSRIISTNGLDKNLLPSYADLDRDVYGLGAEWNNTDNPFYPRKGIFSLLTASAGKKKLIQNTFFNLEAYSKIPESTTSYQFRYKGSVFFTPTKNITVKNQLIAGKISTEKLFYNDLYRFGGFKTLRGFEEKKFAAEEYAIYTLELQYYWEENSYFFIFGEPAIYKGLTLSGQKVKDNPFGMGVGMSFKTVGGVFSFVYALGKDANQPVSLDFSKIHFGFTSRF